MYHFMNIPKSLLHRFKVCLFSKGKKKDAIFHTISSDMFALHEEKTCCCITEYNEAKYDLTDFPLTKHLQD